MSYNKLGDTRLSSSILADTTIDDINIEYALGRTFIETTEKIPEPVEPEEI